MYIYSEKKKRKSNVGGIFLSMCLTKYMISPEIYGLVHKVLTYVEVNVLICLWKRPQKRVCSHWVCSTHRCENSSSFSLLSTDVCSAFPFSSVARQSSLFWGEKSWEEKLRKKRPTCFLFPLTNAMSLYERTLLQAYKAPCFFVAFILRSTRIMASRAGARKPEATNARAAKQKTHDTAV